MTDRDDLPDEWTAEQREIFGKVYRFMLANQGTHCHPQMPKPEEEHWNTICFNSAYLAAEVSDGSELTICDFDTEEILASTETSGTVN